MCEEITVSKRETVLSKEEIALLLVAGVVGSASGEAVDALYQRDWIMSPYYVM